MRALQCSPFPCSGDAHASPRLASALVLALGTSAAHAEIVTIRYDFPARAGLATTFGYFGGDRGPTTGTILSTTLVVNYVTEGTLDAADFYLTFDVPVTGAEQEHIGLTGADLGWSGQGTFHYTFTNDLYSGTIREGRFGAEFNGGGDLVDSYVEFVVDADPAIPQDDIYYDGFDL